MSEFKSLPFIKKMYIYILFYTYIFSIPFTFGFGTRVILGAFGIVHLFLSLISKETLNIKIPRIGGIIGISLLGIFSVSILSTAFNNTADYTIALYPLSVLLIASGCYFVANQLRCFINQISLVLVADICIKVVLFEVILSLIVFAIPPLKEFVQTIIVFEERDMLLSEIRLVGVGAKYFGSGIVNGVALIFISFLYRNDCSSFKRTFVLTVSYLIIFIAGMMMARTTSIGLLLSMLYLFLTSKIIIRIGKKIMRFIGSLLILSGIGCFVFLNLSSETKENTELLFEFGFDIITNYLETGENTDASTNRLAEMYVYPERISTWLIGDGYFSDPNGSGYYMSTDVGYLRLIFYYGIIGTLLFFVYQYLYVLGINEKSYGKYKVLFNILFIYVLILNLKGFADLTVFLMLLLFVDYDKYISKIYEKN